MRIVRNILLTVSLVLATGFLWLSPFFNGIKQNGGCIDNISSISVSSNHSLSSLRTPMGEGCFTFNSGGNSNAAQMRLTSGNNFITGLHEKILSYSSCREKFLSNISVKPFPQYILNYLGSPGCYYIYALREIII